MCGFGLVYSYLCRFTISVILLVALVSLLDLRIHIGISLEFVYSRLCPISGLRICVCTLMAAFFSRGSILNIAEYTKPKNTRCFKSIQMDLLKEYLPCWAYVGCCVFLYIGCRLAKMHTHSKV